MSPVRRNNNRLTTALIATVIVCIILIVGMLAYLVDPGGIFSKEANNTPDPTETIVEIPQDADPDKIQTDLANGSLLTFGNENAKKVAVFASLSDLSRQKNFIGGKPSDFLTAVQKGEVSLALYLTPENEEQKQFVNDVVTVARCRQVMDRSMTSIFTLNAIVAASDNLKGDESIDDIASALKADMSTCPSDAGTQATQSADNATWFLDNVFGVQTHRGLVANGGMVTNLEGLRKGWVDSLVNSDADPSILVSHGDDTKTVTELKTTPAPAQ